MSRSPVFDNFKRAMRIALYCQDNKVSTAEGLERMVAAEARAVVRRANRREVSGGRWPVRRGGRVGLGGRAAWCGLGRREGWAGRL